MDTYLQGNLGKKNHSGEVGTKSEARLGWAGRLLRTRLPIGRACCQDLGQLTEPPTARKAAKTLCKFLCTRRYAGLFCNSSSTCNQILDNMAPTRYRRHLMATEKHMATRRSQ